MTSGFPCGLASSATDLPQIRRELHSMKVVQGSFNLSQYSIASGEEAKFNRTIYEILTFIVYHRYSAQSVHDIGTINAYRTSAFPANPVEGNKGRNRRVSELTFHLGSELTRGGDCRTHLDLPLGSLGRSQA